MQVQCTNPGTKSVTIGKLGIGKVVFSKNGFATVSDEVGQYLVRHYPAIVTKEATKVAKRSRRTSVNKSDESDVSGEQHEVEADVGLTLTPDSETQREGE